MDIQDGGRAVLAAAKDRPMPGDEARLELLREIAKAGGSVTPRRNPFARNGHEYPTVDPGSYEDLRALAERDYLEERYFDRISICSSCSSHHLNVREVCPTCHSTHYSEEVLLHHFRCGFVGRASEFGTGEDHRKVCPKCAAQMKYLGTDHGQLGSTFLCLECGSSFEEPPVRAVCLSCNTEMPGEELPSLEIFGYSLTALGAAAVRRGSLSMNDADSRRGSGQIFYRPSFMRALLDSEATRAQFFRTSFPLIVITGPPVVGDAQAELEGAVADLLNGALRPVDAAGELAGGQFAIFLPQMSIREAEQIRTRIIKGKDPRLALDITLAQVKDPESLAQALHPPR